jgi:hypothetical protein
LQRSTARARAECANWSVLWNVRVSGAAESWPTDYLPAGRRQNWATFGDSYQLAISS